MLSLLSQNYVAEKSHEIAIVRINFSNQIVGLNSCAERILGDGATDIENHLWSSIFCIAHPKTLYSDTESNVDDDFNWLTLNKVTDAALITLDSKVFPIRYLLELERHEGSTTCFLLRLWFKRPSCSDTWIHQKGYELSLVPPISDCTARNPL